MPFRDEDEYHEYDGRFVGPKMKLERKGIPQRLWHEYEPTIGDEYESRDKSANYRPEPRQYLRDTEPSRRLRDDE